MDPEALNAPPLATWRAVTVHRPWITALAWLSSSSLAVFVRDPVWRAPWVATVTVAFALLLLTRWQTERRARIDLTAHTLVITWRSGHVTRHDLADLTRAERLDTPHARWVFHFGRDARVDLPDEHDAAAVIEGLRARLDTRTSHTPKHP